MAIAVHQKKAPRKQMDVSWSLIQLIWTLFPEKKKNVAIKLWVMMLGSMLFEMLSVGLVVPILSVLSKPELLSYFPYVNNLFLDKQGQVNEILLVLGAIIFLITIYFIKTIYLSLFALGQSKFIYGLQEELSNKLFTIYLRQPYTFHLQKNSAFLMRNVQGEINALINMAIVPSMLLMAETLIAIGLFGVLIYFEPVATCVVFGLILLIGYIYQSLIKKHVSNWGKQRQYHEGHRTQHLYQGIGAAKDIMLLGREEGFLKQYALHTAGSMKMNRRQYMMQQMPRLWIEFLSITGLSIFIAMMIFQGYALLDIIPLIALFSAVCFRLMPSANRILNGVQQLRFGLSSVVLLEKELNLKPIANPKNLHNVKAFKDSISLEKVNYVYPGTTKSVLKSIDLKINKSQMVGLVGESGAGKSTLVDIILGLLSPTQGRVMIDGEDLNKNPRNWQDQIGYVPQSIYLTDDTLRRNVAFGLADDEIDDEAVTSALRSAQLENFVNALPEGVNTIVGERGVRFSGGQSQRIGIARALYHDPAVLVLDEATSALDTETEEGVIDAVNSLKTEKTILIITHRLSTLKFCDYIYKVENGQCKKVELSDSH